MKRRAASLVACALCALVACLVVAGCSGAGGSVSPGAKMAGYWELSSASSGGEALTEADVKTMEDLGLKFILHLDEGGKATLDLFGEVEETTWDQSKATMSYGDGAGTLELSDDTLTLTVEGDTLVFKRGDDALASKIEKDRKAQETSDEGEGIVDGSDAEATSVAIEPPVTIADDGYVTIDATARAVDDYGQVGITLSIVNNSERNIGLYAVDGYSAVDGLMRDCYFYARVMPGTRAEEFCAFDGVELLDELVDIQARLNIYDAETFEDLNSYTISIP